MHPSVEQTRPKARGVAKSLEKIKRDDRLSVAALLEARESGSSAYEAKRLGKGWKSSSVQRRLGRKGGAAIRRKKRHALKAGIEAKRKVKPWRGTEARRVGNLVTFKLAVIASWPDRPATIVEARESSIFDLATNSWRAGLFIAWDNGWLKRVAFRKKAKTLNAHTPALRQDYSLFALTAEGRAAQAFAWWAAGRTLLGWPLPMSGVRAEHVASWIRGEAIDVPPKVVRMSEGPHNPHGFLPGQAADDGWPEFGVYPLKNRRL